MSQSIIQTKDLEKIYSHNEIRVKALDGVNLEINEGEFTAIVGPSGSGKSTLLNLIGGLDEPTAGEIIIDNVKLSNLSAAEKVKFRLHKIGFVFQAYNLIPVLTATENIEFIMLLQNRSKQERSQRSAQLIQAVGLENEKNRKPGHLSGGQQQRVAVARALASKPKFILADEPTANLDSTSASNLLDIMVRLNEEEGVTFVFSTHDQRVVDRARRVITLEDGKISSDKSL